jgi:hypothetical protein
LPLTLMSPLNELVPPPSKRVPFCTVVEPVYEYAPRS